MSDFDELEFYETIGAADADTGLLSALSVDPDQVVMPASALPSASRLEIEVSLNPQPVSAMWNAAQPSGWDDEELERAHGLSVAENDCRALIALIMTSSRIDPIVAAAVLKDVLRDCTRNGVSFEKMLELEIPPYGQVPLVLEIMRCDLGAPDLLLFLLEHTEPTKMSQWVREGCMHRRDNLFEKLRIISHQPAIGASAVLPFDYVVSLDVPFATSHSNTSPSAFRALISIPDFAAALRANAVSLRNQMVKDIDGLADDSEWQQRLEATQPGLAVEIIALGRHWVLEVGFNRFTLTLMDGLHCNVDASLMVLEESIHQCGPIVTDEMDLTSDPEPLMIAKLKREPMKLPDASVVQAVEARLGVDLPEGWVPWAGLLSNLESSQTSESRNSSRLHTLTGLANTITNNPGPATENPVTPQPSTSCFPQATLYSQRVSPYTANSTQIPRFFHPHSIPANLVDAALGANQLVVQLIVRLYDQPDQGQTRGNQMIPNSFNVMRSTSLTTGVTDESSRSGVPSTSEAWSYVGHDDVFDTDDWTSYAGEELDGTEGRVSRAFYA